MTVDYIIVGLGIAGIAFAEELENNNKSYIAFENYSQNSSKVAGGMFNPVILKRFTPVWNGTKQLKTAIPFYKKLETKLNIKLIEYIDIYKSFKSMEEQNNWHIACDNPLISNFLDPEIIPNSNKHIIASFGYGKVKNTGKIYTKKLIKKYQSKLLKKTKLLNKTFDYNKLKISNNFIKYDDITASKIVFSEGYGMINNPFFKNLPLNEAKGELLEIYAPELKINFLLKSAVFIIPLGKDNYKIGATFNWNDKTNTPTLQGKQELEKKLKKTITCSYKIINHLAGIRPTVKDRRPLIGSCKKYKNIAILNGLGTRGVMLAPTLAPILYKNLEDNIPIDKEININRFL